MKPAGPTRWSFVLQSHASGDGDLYWTTDAKTTLPRGRHQSFQVNHDGQWHDVALKIPETKVLHAIRLDPCAGPGQVRIDGLRLKDASGTTLKSWP